MKKFRNKTKMSQSQFAEYFGIPVRSLQEWEQGRKKPPSYLLNLLKRIWILEKRRTINMTRQDEIEILISDRCTKIEAIALLKNHTIIFEDINDFLNDANQYKEDDDELITIEEVRAGHIENMSATTYKGKEYYIMYVV